MTKNLIIAFLLGMILMDFAHALKIPDIILPQEIHPDLREIVEDYVVKILNEGKYQMRVSSSTITSGSALNEGEFMMDDSGVTKYFVISNGTNNYRVQVTQI